MVFGRGFTVCLSSCEGGCSIKRLTLIKSRFHKSMVGGHYSGLPVSLTRLTGHTWPVTFCAKGEKC